MAMKVTGLLVLVLGVALTLAEPRIQQRRDIAANGAIVSPNHPYLFLSVPRGRSGAVVHGFEVLQDENDDDEDAADAAHHNDDETDNEPMNDDEDDDELETMVKLNRIAMPLQQNDHDDDDDDDHSASEGVDSSDDENAGHLGQTIVTAQQLLSNTKKNMQMIMRNAKPTHMMVSREHAGAIMVPDGIIEIEGQSVYDEKTGQTALLVPRDALDAVPNGSVVALMERPLDETEEERANRVIVRRRSQASRRKLQRQGGAGKRRRGVRRGSNTIRRRAPSGNNRRRNVRRQPTGGKRRRSRRPTIIQG